MTRALREYQHLAVDHILKFARCNLFIPMGFGKTSIVLHALDILNLSEDVYPALVLAPLRVANATWPREPREWDSLRHINVMAITGTEQERIAAMRFDAQVYCCNYENLEWLVNFWGERWPYKTVVADECTKIKSFRLKQGGKRAAALAKVAHTKVKRYIGLSGSPAAGGLKDLWAIMWFVDIGSRLGRSFSAFTQRWFRTSFDGYGLEAMPHAMDQIQTAIGDVCLSLRVRDWFDVKDPIVRDVWVDIPTKARARYEEMEKEMFTQIEGHEVEAFGAAAKTQKLLQLCNGAMYVAEGGKEWKVVHDEKINALESIIEEANGMPVLVAYQFKSDLARLLKAFPQGRHLDKSPQTITDWNAGKIPLLFAHPASAGHGIQLQYGGNIIVYFAVDWNLELHEQILERLGPVRQKQAGFDRNVFVYRILARDTVDEMVLERLDGKREVQDILLEAIKRRKKCQG